MAITDILTGARGIQSSIPRISSRAVDVVGIFRGSSFSQVVAFARPMAATVMESAELMRHPLEDGSEITDHIVFQPVEIELPLMATGIDFQNSYETLRQLFRDGELLTVQTRTRSYENMVIQELPHEETAAVFDGALINIRFSEAVFVTPEFGELSTANTADTKNASTVKRGAQQTTSTNASQGANAKEVYKNSSNGQAKGSKLHQWFGS